jgi:hypothetical protein
MDHSLPGIMDEPCPFFFIHSYLGGRYGIVVNHTDTYYPEDFSLLLHHLLTRLDLLHMAWILPSATNFLHQTSLQYDHVLLDFFSFFFTVLSYCRRPSNQPIVLKQSSH